MNIGNFTQKSLEAMQSAQALAREHGNQQLEQVHLLTALLKQEGGLIPQLLQKMEKTPESMLAAAKAEVARLPKVSGSREADRFYISQQMDTALQAAQQQAETMKDEFVSVEHLFLGLLDGADTTLKQLFSTYRIQKESCLQALQSIRGNQRVTSDSPEGTYDALSKYGTDLVKKAREQKMDSEGEKLKIKIKCKK